MTTWNAPDAATIEAIWERAIAAEESRQRFNTWRTVDATADAVWNASIAAEELAFSQTAEGRATQDRADGREDTYCARHDYFNCPYIAADAADAAVA